MTDQAVARRVPWATVIGWVALLLAVVGAAGVVVAGIYAVDGARNPQSFGTLGAVVVLMYSLVPSLLALPVGIAQARRGWAPRWRSSTTVVLAALAPVATAVVLLVVAARDLSS
ncbi:hypothetical protein [Cellulomonas sp. Root485]|uniref:hypothetical protein n=1 Tax=Cellulomonas sp. Root485 TaxID=1736546 RepID=UPI000A8C02A3|nr:hypothetical protein [Cellulomonas sp. Root485]